MTRKCHIEQVRLHQVRAVCCLNCCCTVRRLWTQRSVWGVHSCSRVGQSLIQNRARLPVLLKWKIQSHISSKWSQSFAVDNLTHSCVSTQIFMVSFSRNPPGRAPWRTGSPQPQFTESPVFHPPSPLQTETFLQPWLSALSRRTWAAFIAGPCRTWKPSDKQPCICPGRRTEKL